MLLTLMHRTVVALYLALPVLGLLLALWVRRRRHDPAALGSYILSVIAGLLLGSGLTFIYALAVGGRFSIGQGMLASWFAIALLLVLKGYDALLRRVLRPVIRVRRDEQSRPVGVVRRTAVLAFVLRAILLFAVGLPYVMASAMVYRPRAAPQADPQAQIGYAYTPASFRSSDGLMLSAWWIPALKAPHVLSEAAQQRWGTSTVVICHGLGGGKSSQLFMAGQYAPYGYNVLIFDFRAHGNSAGQITTFGDLERFDVLGAVRWLRESHPQQAQHIYGVGASMGAAALIAAAADRSPEGRAIDAIAVYGTYGDFGTLVKQTTSTYFRAPLGWLSFHLGLPMASLTVGRDLGGFAPAKLVGDIWPRPILIIHGLRDQIIPFTQGEDLERAAWQPKDHLWVPFEDHNRILHSDRTARVVRDFFNTARPLPLI